MKKIFKISAALMAVCVFATSVNAVALAEQTSETKNILLYEDFENIDYTTAFGSATTDTNYLPKVKDTTTQQYQKTHRQANGVNVTGVADSAGNKMMNLSSVSTACGNTGSTWTAAIMQFDDKNSDNVYDSWCFDSENLDNELVISYDLSLSNTNWDNLTEVHNSRFYGGPANATANLYAWNAGGLYGTYLDEETTETRLRYGIRTTAGASWTNANNINVTDVNFDEKVKVTYKFTKDGKYRVWVRTADGSDVSNELTTTLTSINQIKFVVDKGHGINIDNVRAYTVPTDATLAVTSADKTDVGLTDSLDVTVNGYIPERALSAIVVKNGDAVIEPSEYTISVADNSSVVESTITVKFNDKMSFGTTYSVVMPTTLKDEAQDSFADETAANFTTIAAPSFDIALTATAGGETVNALADAAGKSIVCDLDITHTTTRNSSGVIFVGLYDAEGNVVAYGASDKAYTPNETDEIKVSLNVPEDTTGMSIKAFGCESLAEIDNIFSSVVTLQ